jgi:hypothetical protein
LLYAFITYLIYANFYRLYKPKIVREGLDNNYKLEISRSFINFSNSKAKVDYKDNSKEEEVS